MSSPATHDRFIGFLIEHHDGNFPLWLAPDAARLRKGIVAELRSLRDLVKDAIREALRLDETWNLRFQFLLRKDHPLKTGSEKVDYVEENDIECFETDREIRTLISLPPDVRSAVPESPSSDLESELSVGSSMP